MKTINLLLIATAITVGCVEAQDIPRSEVPSVVANAFQVAFPQATDVEWELQGDQYKVDFEIGRADHDVWFDKEGKTIKHKEEIAASDLPAAVTTAIRKDFSAYRVEDVEKIEEQGNVSYEMELDGSPTDLKVVFSADGKILRKTND
jgi:hypothetical protein